MSDELKHECGIAMIRLLKPLEYYQKKYGTSLYALNKMYLLMQKQVNRGQDGAGLANIKLNVEPGKRSLVATDPTKQILYKTFSHTLIRSLKK